MMVHSFDVFDTCLTRRVTEPSAVFYDVARRAYARMGLAWTPALGEEFLAARILAERQARDRSGREEITLAEIWHRLSVLMGWPDDPSLAVCELDAEEAVLFPIPAVQEMIQGARSQGGRIVFVSDMYLPAEFIQRQLFQHGIAEKGDSLYVSCEVGKTKRTGNLFKHVLANEKVGPENCVTPAIIGAATTPSRKNLASTPRCLAATNSRDPKKR